MHKGYGVNQIVDGIYEKEFRGVSGIRPDFVDLKNKGIYELKPFNPRAMQQGLNQLLKYQKTFQSKYPGTSWKIYLDTY